MMGLLGNVAEVRELRPRLMQTHFISEFSDLLFSTQDGIEVFITIFTSGTLNTTLYLPNRLVIMPLGLLHIWRQMVIKHGLLRPHQGIKY